MFSKSARFYDAIYATIEKDYKMEADIAHQFIQQKKSSLGNALLEVACGTGLHASYFQNYYQVEGLDLDPEMLAVASQNNPAIPFHQGDMVDFKLDQKYDVITCLFSSIGYVKTKERLAQAIRTMAGHLVPGGVLVIEPWFTPDKVTTGRVGALFVDQPEIKISRMSRSEKEGNLSILHFHYLVATSESVDYFAERHELGLFTDEEYLDAFRKTGLDVSHEPEGVDGRGLYIGLKS